MSAPTSSPQVTVDPADMPALLGQMEEITRTLISQGYDPFLVKNQTFTPGATGPNTSMGDALSETFLNKMVTITLMLSQIEGSRDVNLDLDGNLNQTIKDSVGDLSFARTSYPNIVDGVFPPPVVAMAATTDAEKRMPIYMNLVRLIGIPGKMAPFAALVYLAIWVASCGRAAGAPIDAGEFVNLWVTTDGYQTCQRKLMVALRGVGAGAPRATVHSALQAAATAVYNSVQGEINAYSGVGAATAYGSTLKTAFGAAAGASPAKMLEVWKNEAKSMGVSDAAATAWAGKLLAITTGSTAAADDTIRSQAAVAPYKRAAGGAAAPGFPGGGQTGGALWGYTSPPVDALAAADATTTAYEAAFTDQTTAYQAIPADQPAKREQFDVWSTAVMQTYLWDHAEVAAVAGGAQAEFDAVVDKFIQRLDVYRQAIAYWNKFFESHNVPKSIQYMEKFDIFESSLYRYLAYRVQGTRIQTAVGQKTRTTVNTVQAAYRKICETPLLQDYFTLLHLNGTAWVPVDLDTICKDPTADLSQYSLNVKKEKDTGTVMGGGCRMVGGAPNDILWLSSLPAWSGGFVYGGQLQTGAQGWLVDLLRRVYYSGGRSGAVNIPGTSINAYNLAAAVQNSRRQTVMIGQNWGPLMDNLLSLNTGIGANPVDAIAWNEKDLHISEDLWEARSMWKAEDGKMVLKDDKGVVQNVAPMDSCGFVTEDGGVCHNLLQDCTVGDCSALMDLDIKIPPTISEMTATVMKIPPIHAMKVLNHYRFGMVDTQTDKVLPGLIRYKVQSVSSWLAQLLSGQDRCNPTPTPGAGPTAVGCGSLRDQLGAAKAAKLLAMAKDPQKKTFFDYLQILVSWVNANPRLLNPQEADYSSIPTEEPPADPRYKIYHHHAYGMNQPNRASLTCGMQELLANLEQQNGNIYGSDAISTIQDISFTPNINMPFSRSAFLGPFPNVHQSPMGLVFGGFGAHHDMDHHHMQGGHWDMDHHQMQGGNWAMNANMTNSRAFGTKAYERMIDMLQARLVKSNGGRGLTQKSRNDIQTRLDGMRQANDELLSASKDLAERLYYYKKFQGKLDTFGYLDEIKKKQYLLMDKSKQYNTSLGQVGNIILRLTEILQQSGDPIGRLDPNTYRPLTANVHDVQFEKRF